MRLGETEAEAGIDVFAAAAKKTFGLTCVGNLPVFWAFWLNASTWC